MFTDTAHCLRPYQASLCSDSWNHGTASLGPPTTYGVLCVTENGRRYDIYSEFYKDAVHFFLQWLSPTQAIMSRSQEEKEKFFAELFKLDALANDSDPESDGVQLPKLRVGSPSPQEMFRQTQINQAPSVVNDSDRAGSSSMMDTEKPKRTRCVQPTEAAAPSKKRRKKEKGLPPLPEKDRVFNDQVFCMTAFKCISLPTDSGSLYSK